MNENALAGILYRYTLVEIRNKKRMKELLVAFVDGKDDFRVGIPDVHWPIAV